MALTDNIEKKAMDRVLCMKVDSFPVVGYTRKVVGKIKRRK